MNGLISRRAVEVGSFNNLGSRWRLPQAAAEENEPNATSIVYRVPIWPPLEIWLIEPVEVIHQAGVRVQFLAGEAVEVHSGQRPALVEDVSIRIVQVLGDDGLVRVDEAGNI